ncbi:hypothetical protein GW17_00041576 [Ensete ventricosum]|nr:hypothetical protein GW17_00041576 [Ensete ventricosum]
MSRCNLHAPAVPLHVITNNHKHAGGRADRGRAAGSRPLAARAAAPCGLAASGRPLRVGRWGLPALCDQAVGGSPLRASRSRSCSRAVATPTGGRPLQGGMAAVGCPLAGGRSYIPVFHIRMEKMKEVQRPPLIDYERTRPLRHTGDSGRSKGVTTVHSYGGNFLCAYSRRTIEPRGMKDKDYSLTSHVEAYCSLYCHPSPAPKKLIRDELRERSAKGLYCHYDIPWSCEHHCKKGRLLMIESAKDEDNETFKEALEPKEEAMEEESQSADYVVHALAGYSNPKTMKVGGLLK